MPKRNNPDEFAHEDHQEFIERSGGKYKFYVKDKEGIWGAFDSPRYPRHTQNVFFKRLVNFSKNKNVIEDRVPFYRVVAKDVLGDAILSGKFDISLNEDAWPLIADPEPDPVYMPMDDDQF